MKVATTCFQKKSYSTWIHPRSEKPHQIDHFIVSNDMFHRVTDAGVTSPLLDSDHRAISMTLRVMKRLKKKCQPRQRMKNLDYSVLSDPNQSKRFCQQVSSKISVPSQVTYTELSEAVKTVSLEILSTKKRAQPGWFQAKAERLKTLIRNRNQAMKDVFDRRTRSCTEKLKSARQKLKSEIKSAKNEWIQNHCHSLNTTFGTKSSWDAIKSLKNGLTKAKATGRRQMKHPDGTICKTPEENAAVFCEHFKALYGKTPDFDETVLELLPQCPIVEGCDHLPNDDEIRNATLRLKNTAPGDSGICAPALKCLLDSDETFALLKSIVLQFWRTEIVPLEWNTGGLTILPKKGDLSWPKNYRGIMLLEIAYKIVAIILHCRLEPIMESLDQEPQCGFRTGRSCMDSIFTIKIALKKRREHGLESWVLFLDLVKAFDRVPRQVLWSILEKFGVPAKLVSLLKALHTEFKVKFTVDEVTQTLNCIIGVKQGDVLGPILFNFFMAAVMITWRSNCTIHPCKFKTKRDFILTGRSYRAYGEEFCVPDSEYADDTAVIFDSRTDLENEVPNLMQHFLRFGMEIHTGQITPREDSKTEILFCSKPLTLYNDPDNFDDADLSDLVVGFNRYIPIVEKFVYLGSIVSRDCSDEEDINARIVKAGSAFANLRKCIFSSSQVFARVKGEVYKTYILPILLYGAECWSLTEILCRRLKSFHHRCIRAMCRISRKQSWEYRITNVELMNRVSIISIDTYIVQKQLRWAGHVSRMPWNRLPRKMLSCWVRSKRPRGSPKFTYGRALYKSLKKAKIDVDGWEVTAQDRDIWRSMINNLNL